MFEGPFDLLLFFIERDELEIRDIPISKITADFLDYLQHLDQMNIEVASEFILVAATLMQIKAKMLLPRVETDELGNDIDPREELIRHLLEYKKYKSVLSTFNDLEANRLLMEKRGNIIPEITKLSESNQVETELQDFDLYKLLKIYVKAINRYEAEKSKPVHSVEPYPYSMENQKSYILNLVKQKQNIAFEEIIGRMPSKIAIIFNFLSILELLSVNQIKITIGEGYNNFWIGQPEQAEETATHSLI